MKYEKKKDENKDEVRIMNYEVRSMNYERLLHPS
jgi:hypothetical protein